MRNNRQKESIKKNYIYNLIYQILVVIVPLITTPYLSRVLGAENIGIYSYTLSITTYFILFGTLGVSLYGQREIAYIQDKKEERSKVFWEILIMRFFTLGISMILFYCIFCSHGEYSLYYKILLMEMIAYSIDISWFFQGLEEFKKTITRNLIVKIISVILIFISVKESNDLIKYFLIYVMSTLIGNASLWIYVPQYVRTIPVKKLRPFKHLKPTIGLFIPQIAIQVYTVLDKTMIGMMVNDKSEVGFYEQSQKIIKLLLTIATSLGVVMIPRMANTFANGEKEKINYYMKKSFQFVLIMAFPLMFGIISISNKFVPIFYGNGYDKVITLIIIISPILLAIGLSNTIGQQYLLPTKRQKEFTISVTVGAVVNFVFNLILIRYGKSVGAAIATVIAEWTVTIIQMYFIKNEINVVEIIKIAKNYFIASSAMFIVSIFLGLFIKDNIISIIVQVLCSCIMYFIVLFLLKDELLSECVRMINKLLRGVTNEQNCKEVREKSK